MRSRRIISLAARTALVVACLALPIFGETVFTNQPRTVDAAAKHVAPTAPLTFTLNQPMLVTSVKTYSPGNAAPGTIRLYRRGYLLMRKKATRDQAYWTVQPNLVYPAGTYVISESRTVWSSVATSSGQGVATVDAQPLSAADLLKASTYFQLTSCPISIADIAKLDMSKMKQDIDAQANGLQTTVEKKGGLSDLAKQHNAQTGRDQDTPASVKKPLDDFKNNSVTPRNQRDTFGGHRVDDPLNHSPSDYHGNSRGLTMDGDEDTPTVDEGQGVADAQKAVADGGGHLSGDPQQDVEECAYMMNCGSADWQATKDMNQVERKAYWNDKRREQKGENDPHIKGVYTPRESDDGYGGFKIFGTPQMREMQRRFIDRAISGRRGQADGGVQQTGGGAMMPQTSKDDRPDKERGGGTINWDAVLKINQVVNPGRT